MTRVALAILLTCPGVVAGQTTATNVIREREAAEGDILLVDGALVLSARDADLLRAGGRLSKSPSFWISRVEVVRRYARVAGVRVPVELESTAHVRLAGPSVMQITYSYDSINGQPVLAH